MKRVTSILVVSLGLTSSVIACSGESGPDTVDGTENVDVAAQALARFDGGALPRGKACGAPARTTPTFVAPATDKVALDSLLEGAGYGSSTNSDWTDITSGNFCGGSEKELVLLKNRHSSFSVMRGPTPYAVAAFDFPTDDAHPWRAVSAGDFDKDGLDEIVAVRKVTVDKVADVVVLKVDPKSCLSTSVLSSAVLGGTKSPDWVDVAVGNFDGKGKAIALLRNGQGSFTVARPNGATIDVTYASDLDTSAAYPWKGIAAGDLDKDGIDELVATRQVGDGKGTTVVVYKWIRDSFRAVATSTFGNNGNSDWAGVAVGDFNGDGRAAIALTKNNHSNFAILDLVPGSAQLRSLATADLDSVAGQSWRGVTAVDWLGGDQGAAELIAVRAASNPYRNDLFVYGNAFHRVPRDTGLEDLRAEWDQQRGVDPEVMKAWLTESHTNSVSWHLASPTDYDELIAFLTATRDFCVDGRQLRVTVSLIPPWSAASDNASLPTDNPSTAWNELSYFIAGPGADPVTLSRDMLGWGSAIGRLAVEFPHLTSASVDDFMNHPDLFSEEVLAEMQSRIRAQAPWVSFVPTGYWHNMSTSPPDLARGLDNVTWYFRNEKNGTCLTDPCGTQSVGNVPSELADEQAFLPAGRRLQVGTYWGLLYSTPGNASNRYDHDLVRLLRNLPGVAGVTAYPMIAKTPGFVCNEYNVLEDELCTLQRVYGATPHPATDTDLTGASGAALAAGNPFAYVFANHGVQNIVYRATDGHAHELWRTTGAMGHSDLTALGGAPAVQGDPTAYVFAAHDLQNVVYRGTDNHIHGLYWSTGAVGHDNLTALAGAPFATANAYGYAFDATGYQNVLYRATDGHLHGLYWSTGAVGNDDLTALSGASAPTTNDPFGYLYPAAGVQNALYRGNDGHLHGLYWSTGAVGHDDLTSLSGAPAPAGAARAYIAPTYNLQNAVYRGVDGRLHGLYWSTGAVGHDDLSSDSRAPLPASDPSPYFVTGNGSHHVVYRSADGHVRALSWTVGMVAHDDLTLLSGAPPATGNPSEYFGLDGRHHIVYRSADGHLHDVGTAD